MGTAVIVKINIANKLWSLERVNILVEMCDDFIITGGSNQAYEVAPSGTLDILLKLVPIECGLVPLPNIRATWERDKKTIFETGTVQNPHHIFIMPSGNQISQN